MPRTVKSVSDLARAIGHTEFGRAWVFQNVTPGGDDGPTVMSLVGIFSPRQLFGALRDGKLGEPAVFASTVEEFHQTIPSVLVLVDPKLLTMEQVIESKLDPPPAEPLPGPGDGVFR